MATKKIGFGSLCTKEVQSHQTTKSHVLPLLPTSSFSFQDIDQGMRIFKGEESGHVYSRYGNPTCDALAQKISDLETHGLELEATTQLFSSGMSAIHTLVIALLQPGDLVITQGNLYGGTTELFSKVIARQGIRCLFTDLRDVENLKKVLSENEDVKMVYFESPANPTLACVDLKVVGQLCQEHKCYSVIDNTFCTPYLQKPFQYQIDFVVHSTTKYINGHGNAIGGSVTSTHKEVMSGSIWQTMKLAGSNANPFDSWLAYNGLKTLHLRMDRHCDNAQKLAEFLASHPKVNRVNYLGLPTHPDHALASRQMGGFGGMLSFELSAGLQGGIDFMRKIKFCTLAPTLGDVDTLLLHPASMSHINVDRELRERNGITDGLIRVSVGIEDIDDIIADIEQALD